MRQLTVWSYELSGISLAASSSISGKYSQDNLYQHGLNLWSPVPNRIVKPEADQAEGKVSKALPCPFQIGYHPSHHPANPTARIIGVTKNPTMTAIT